ncbi:hypothetical protein [Bacillus glycinifermentans]|uniref:Uncharacterized protein n=1 Tax=Bacillus glycinifermentans TaxID=1664069 RepID=A0ABU6GY46_9BACI|nr:hypothetical protein [Bacillus glycinifermentans]MEC0483259.1 hypothetical protein [Bacillus glycinifermentans]MEC0493120.1 hypothetical protein [Bacillus glycinifermentans]MEC0541420.1 hypothetical protein [Bacillus glycinifermentans]MEC3606711.1 hypothetical protein [Bacillus glycinifermentans]
MKSALISAIYAAIIVFLGEYLLNKEIKLFIEIPLLVIGILIIYRITKGSKA